MTTVPQSTNRKLSLPRLAEGLGKVSKACEIMDYHRDTFYRGQLKGVGKIYVQLVVDAFCSLAFAKVGSPRTIGFVERMNRTLLDEHFRIKGRRKLYESAEQIHADLDQYLVHCNNKRPHQDYGMNEKTPYNAFKKGLAERPSPSKKKEARIAT